MPVIQFIFRILNRLVRWLVFRACMTVIGLVFMVLASPFLVLAGTLKFLGSPSSGDTYTTVNPHSSGHHRSW